MTDPPETLRPCQNHLCERAVGGSAPHCCGPCSSADERHYEIHEAGPLGHTEPCSERWAERRPRFRPNNT